MCPFCAQDLMLRQLSTHSRLIHSYANERRSFNEEVMHSDIFRPLCVAQLYVLSAQKLTPSNLRVSLLRIVIVNVSAHLSHYQREPNTRKTRKKSLRYILPRMCNYCMYRILQQVLCIQYKSVLKNEKQILTRAHWMIIMHIYIYIYIYIYIIVMCTMYTNTLYSVQF